MNAMLMHYEWLFISDIYIYMTLLLWFKYAICTRTRGSLMELARYLYPAGGSFMELESYLYPVRRFLYGTGKLFVLGRRFLYGTDKYDLWCSVYDLLELTDELWMIKHDSWVIYIYMHWMRSRIRIGSMHGLNYGTSII